MYVPRLLIRSTACPKEKLYPAATPNTATVALIFGSMVIFSPPCSAYANERTNQDKAMIRIPARIKYFLPYRTFQLFYCETSGREFDLCHGWKISIEFFASKVSEVHEYWLTTPTSDVLINLPFSESNPIWAKISGAKVKTFGWSQKTCITWIERLWL